jgi:hypothetical protein
MRFKPADLDPTSKAVTWVFILAFVVTLSMSLWVMISQKIRMGSLTATVVCIILALTLVTCWLFSVRAYVVSDGKVVVQHPLWGATFEVRGLATESRSPFHGSVRLFASNWIFGHSLGLMFNERIGRFLAFETNANYRIALETEKGVLVLSPADREGMIRFITQQ